MRLLIAATIICCSSLATAQAYRVGDRVVVVTKDAPIKIGRDVVDRGALGTALTVTQVNGDWLRVSNQQTGWIEKTDVVAVDQAMEYFSKAIIKNPDNTDFVDAQALVRDQNGGVSFAIEEFTKLIAKEPNEVYYRTERANAFIEKKELLKAIDDFTQAIRLDPSESQWYFRRADCKADMGDLKGAIADDTEAIRLNSDYVDALAHRGYLRLNLYDYKEAIADSSRAILLDPDYEMAYENRGLSRMQLEDFAGAAADYSEVLRIHPNYHQAFRNRAVCNDSMGNFKDALADFKKAVEIWPGDVASSQGIAWLLATCPEVNLRDPKKAVEIAEDLVRHRAEYIALIDEWKSCETMAAAYAANGNFEGAIKWQTIAIERAHFNDRPDFRARLELFKQHKPYVRPAKK
ncbi:MAG: tetratricopeptide repeat protein [Planctomycetia bacterium]|nr:tetratricopeptide repeat protein [Planctomycetia bacterium]